MNRAIEFVLDASAIFALLDQEPGWETVDAVTRRVVSVVNVAEVGTVLVNRGYIVEQFVLVLASLQLETIDFDSRQAYETARLRAATKSAGLSLGDRACLALAGALRLPVLTADRAWRDIDVGVTIELIR